MGPLNFFYNRTYGYVRGVLALLIGVALIVWPEYAQKYLMTVIGSVVILFGIISLITSNVGRENSSVMSFNGIVNIIFGIILITSPIFFLSFLTFIFGALLLLIGIGAIGSALTARKSANVGFGVFLMPVLITLAGTVMLFSPRETNEALFIFFGVVVALYGVSELFTAIKVTMLMRKEKEDDGIEDAVIIEEDDDKA